MSGVRPYIIRGAQALLQAGAAPRRVDVAVGADGRIGEVGRDLPASPGIEELDCAGKLVCSGFVDVHQHLDKALTRGEVANPDGTLAGAVAAFNAYASRIGREDLLARAERAIRRSIERGTVAIRTHANVDTELKTRSVAAMVELRERVRDRVTVQVVAFVTSGATRVGVPAREWLDEAVSLGADVIGGTPHIADSPGAFLDLLFDAAERHGLPLDLHFDEHLDPDRQLFDQAIERTKARGLAGRVALGHCCALAAMPPDEASRIIDGLRAADIAVITLPAANLFLQGRSDVTTPRRGLTRVRELMEAGVPVAAASDNVEDVFIPVGSGDMLETARWTALSAQLDASKLDAAFSMVTHVPARIMGLGGDYGIRPGARADLVITEGKSAEDLVARGPLRRTVIVGGRVVAGATEAGG